ncbi:Concanavalin A-like lectin/glucanase subgroup [Penicillium verhagenii]|nr:Concanavalin A-like lectin/glucanase subgroup [Penicillium verhagenii]
MGMLSAIPDWNNHCVLETPIPNISSPAGVRYDFVWDENEITGRGHLVWLIDGKPIVRAEKPPGTGKMSDFRIFLNIVVRGNIEYLPGKYAQ